MELFYHRRFKKEYRKLPLKIQRKTDIVIRRFQKDPYHHNLYNHPLSGSLEGNRTISVSGDWRIMFREDDNYQKVTLLRIGTHAQLYG